MSRNHLRYIPFPPVLLTITIKVKEALENLPLIDDVTVSAAEYGPNGWRTWRVTFSGVEVEGNIPLLAVDPIGITGTGGKVAVTESIPGNEPSGRFMLQTDTAPRGWPEHRSSWISIGASASEVEEAILQISGVDAVDVRVNASLPSTGPIAWEITFSHRKLVSEGAGDDGVKFVATGHYGNRQSLRVVKRQLNDGGTHVEAKTVRDGDRAISGAYEMYLQGDEATSVTIGASASAVAVHRALVQGLGLPEATAVTRAGPLGDNLAYTWTVTLPLGTKLWTYGNGDGRLIVNASRLSGVDGAFVNATLVRAGAPALGGSFNLSLNEEPWLSVPYNSTDNEVAQAISSFAASGGNVSISSKNIRNEHVHQGAIGKTWTVTFSELAAAGNVPEIEVNGSGLVGSNVRALVNESSRGITADIQKIVIDGYNGTFAIFTEPKNISSNSSSNSSAALIPWDASPSQLADAFWEATGKRVYVERYPLTSLNSGKKGYFWLVLFAEALKNTWGNVHLNRSGLIPYDDHLAGEYRQANLTMVKNSTADTVGGGFTLRFGQACENRAAGVYCSAAETRRLRLDSSADEIEAALEHLPSILEATVSGGGNSPWDGIGKVAPSGFGVTSAGTRFRVTLNEVLLNVSYSGVAEYWHRTWSPDNASTEWSGDLVTGGDLPLLGVDVSEMLGSQPAGWSTEVTKGLSTKVGGVVAVEVSQNAGYDYTTSGMTYVYEPLVLVDRIIPNHGPIQGGTQVRKKSSHYAAQILSHETSLGVLSSIRWTTRVFRLH